MSVLHSCFYTLPVTDAATAPASSSQPSTTTQTTEKPSSHVVGMYITLCMYKIVTVEGMKYAIPFVLYCVGDIKDAARVTNPM